MSYHEISIRHAVRIPVVIDKDPRACPVSEFLDDLLVELSQDIDFIISGEILWEDGASEDRTHFGFCHNFLLDAHRIDEEGFMSIVHQAVQSTMEEFDTHLDVGEYECHPLEQFALSECES